MVTFLFYVFAALVLAGGLLAVTRKEPVHCALWLVVTLFGLSVMYLLLNAEFLFAVQVFIYAGGIMVLYLFVIFLVEPGQGDGITPEPRLHRMIGPPVVLIFSPVIIYLLMGIQPARKIEAGALPAARSTLERVLALGPRGVADPAQVALVEDPNGADPRFRDIGNTKVFGLQLFSRYLFPFELISIVLLIAMLGAIILARKRFTSFTPEEEAEMLAQSHYQGRRLAQPSGEPAERILEELEASDKSQHQHPGTDFKVLPDYEA